MTKFTVFVLLCEALWKRLFNQIEEYDIFSRDYPKNSEFNFAILVYNLCKIMQNGEYIDYSWLEGYANNLANLQIWSIIWGQFFSNLFLFFAFNSLVRKTNVN